jgi:hypothetical protein
MMQNSYDEDDGIKDSNNEPRRSPRQTTANNHQLASSEYNCVRYSPNITGTDRRSVGVLTVTRPYNTVHAVKYHGFAQFLTPIGAHTSLIY